jgi:uncharacterized protein with GYD domain
MTTYFMFGKYTADALSGVSSARSQEAYQLVKGCGGEVKEIYALLGGEHDLVIITEMPGVEDAMKASIELTRKTGIQFSSCSAIPVDQFDDLCS